MKGIDYLELLIVLVLDSWISIGFTIASSYIFSSLNTSDSPYEDSGLWFTLATGEFSVVCTAEETKKTVPSSLELLFVFSFISIFIFITL